MLPTISAAMPFQMALDEILLQRMKADSLKPVLRFYFSAGPWLTVGYSEKNLPSAENGVPVCRRITGGGRVIHGNDLIFSFVAAKEHDESFHSVRLSYLKIHEAVKAGFEFLGERPRFYRCDENLPKGQDCFLFPIATDLGLNRKKIAGGAQKRSGKILLHQESIKIPSALEADQRAEALCRGIEQVFGVRLVRADLAPQMMEEAEKLSRERYERQL